MSRRAFCVLAGLRRPLPLLMESLEETDLCFPQLLNTSCRKIHYPIVTSFLIHALLSCISPLTAFFNLLVIISISHFRCMILFFFFFFNVRLLGYVVMAPV